eukprot:COSAG01_NODE_926_length_12694_cov_4.945137_1_plen_1540_part_00
MRPMTDRRSMAAVRMLLLLTMATLPPVCASNNWRVQDPSVSINGGSGHSSRWVSGGDSARHWLVLRLPEAYDIRRLQLYGTLCSHSISQWVGVSTTTTQQAAAASAGWAPFLSYGRQVSEVEHLLVQPVSTTLIRIDVDQSMCAGSNHSSLLEVAVYGEPVDEPCADPLAADFALCNGGNWKLAFALDVPAEAAWQDSFTSVPYAVADIAQQRPIASTAFHVKVDGEWIFLSMLSLTPNRTRVGIPTGWSFVDGARQLYVRSNAAGLSSLVPLRNGTGGVEFVGRCNCQSANITGRCGDPVCNAMRIYAIIGDANVSLFRYAGFNDETIDKIGIGLSYQLASAVNTRVLRVFTREEQAATKPREDYVLLKPAWRGATWNISCLLLGSAYCAYGQIIRGCYGLCDNWQQPSYDAVDEGATIQACSQLPRWAASGVYNLTIRGTRFPVYCDMASDGGGWTLVGSSTGSALSDFASGYHANLATLSPSPQQHGNVSGIWSALRTFSPPFGDFRVSCKVNADALDFQVDMSFYNTNFYHNITSSADESFVCFQAGHQARTLPSPARQNLLTGERRPAGNAWSSGALVGEDRCDDAGDFAIDFDDRGMDSAEADGTDWGVDDGVKKCGNVRNPSNGGWWAWYRPFSPTFVQSRLHTGYFDISKCPGSNVSRVCESLCSAVPWCAAWTMLAVWKHCYLYDVNTPLTPCVEASHCPFVDCRCELGFCADSSQYATSGVQGQQIWAINASWVGNPKQHISWLDLNVTDLPASLRQCFPPVRCGRNMFVFSHQCRHCEGGTISPGGDNAAGPDTACVAVSCPQHSTAEPPVHNTSFPVCKCSRGFYGSLVWNPLQKNFSGTCAVDCGPLHVSNGFRSTSSGSFVTIACAPGYKLLGNSSVAQCRSSGKWETNATCALDNACVAGVHTCGRTEGNHAQCQNTGPGTHNCICEESYFKVSGRCLPCSSCVAGKVAVRSCTATEDTLCEQLVEPCLFSARDAIDAPLHSALGASFVVRLKGQPAGERHLYATSSASSGSVAAFSLPVSPPRCTTVPHSTSACFSFDGSAMDYVANRPATVHGNKIFWRSETGDPFSSLHFGSSNSTFVTLRTPPVATTHNFTILLTLQPYIGSANRSFGLVDLAGLSSCQQFSAWIGPRGNLHWSFCNSTSTTAAEPCFRAGEYVHLALRKLGSAISVFCNGVMVGSSRVLHGSSTSSVFSANGRYWLGRAGAAQDFFVGNIDDAVFVSAAMSDAEISAQVIGTRSDMAKLWNIAPLGNLPFIAPNNSDPWRGHVDWSNSSAIDCMYMQFSGVSSRNFLLVISVNCTADNQIVHRGQLHFPDERLCRTTGNCACDLIFATLSSNETVTLHGRCREHKIVTVKGQAMRVGEIVCSRDPRHNRPTEFSQSGMRSFYARMAQLVGAADVANTSVVTRIGQFNKWNWERPLVVHTTSLTAEPSDACATADLKLFAVKSAVPVPESSWYSLASAASEVLATGSMIVHTQSVTMQSGHLLGIAFNSIALRSNSTVLSAHVTFTAEQVCVYRDLCHNC